MGEMAAPVQRFSTLGQGAVNITKYSGVCPAGEAHPANISASATHNKIVFNGFSPFRLGPQLSDPPASHHPAQCLGLRDSIRRCAGQHRTDR